MISAPAQRVWTAWQAARQLGARQVAWYALYQAALHAGIWQWLTPPAPSLALATPLKSPFSLPEAARIENLVVSERTAMLAEADEIVHGQVRLFGGPAVALQLAPPGPLAHWTAYEQGRVSWGAEDVKLIWEPARFGWVYPLGRAYLLTGSPEYPSAFWRYFRLFSQANPVNQGPNWTSGQEVALRLLALLFAARVFSSAPESTPGNLALLAGAVALHARRIVPTLSYARAQHNNHLISEGLGLYLAGSALPGDPQAVGWHELGWKTLCQALQSQISPEGIYAQHSTNYHRLMLQAALLGALPGRPYPEPVQQRLSAATGWLLAQVDPDSGQAPNYGSNDGAYIFPLAPGGFGDYRPVLQAAARAFVGRPAFPGGPWDEMGLWLGIAPGDLPALPPLPHSPAIHRLGGPGGWAVLRAVHYTGRPSQADQLHVDLWHRGHNIALDAGTYRYSAPSPWDNALGRTRVHNTLEIDGQDQMRRAGRFLWLDWAQASVREDKDSLEACHDGYLRLGVRHCRRLQRLGNGQWLVEDRVETALTVNQRSVRPKTFCLHWLLPDWPWQLSEQTISLRGPWGGLMTLTLSLQSSEGLSPHISLVRAGQALAGIPTVSPNLGWVSPTYDCKLPALSYSMHVQASAPLIFHSHWRM